MLLVLIEPMPLGSAACVSQSLLRREQAVGEFERWMPWRTQEMLFKK